MNEYWIFNVYKGIVNHASRDPTCKYGNARFTTVPLKALSKVILQCL